jgi:phospholipid/cholesterol/gamma-HCH transport system substrate-binding protein
METRANFVVIGAFTLAAVVAAFLFLMWIVGYGTSGVHRRYQIVFNGSVSGLSNGALVLFNGLKVGEVTNLSFVERNPNQVVADIDVTNASAPINANTKAQLETQGLTGSATVSLIGGEQGGAELKGADGHPPVIPSLPTATLADLQTKAGYVLDLANKLLVDNAQPLHQTIENAQSFSMALANNADGVDSALKGLGELGKTIEPLAARLQVLSDDADRVVKAIEPDKVREIVDNVANLSAKAGGVLDRADKLIAENAEAIRTTTSNASDFTKTLKDNSANIDSALKGLGELGKTLPPLTARLQSLSDDADNVVKAVEPDKVHEIVDNVANLSAKAGGVLDRADKLIAENAEAIRTTTLNASAVSKTLADNSANIDSALKGLGELGKTLPPLTARLQSLSDDADRIVKAVEPDKVRSVVANAQTFSDALAASSKDYQNLVRDGASLAARLNDTSKQLDAAIADAQGVLKAIDPHKVSGIVDSVGDVVATVRQNRGNIDNTLKNVSEMSAKLNESADKVDGVLTSAQSFLGSPGTKGAVSQIGDAAQSVKKLADDVDARLKEIAVGLSHFSNSGLRQYEALAVQAQRVLEDIDQTVRSFKQNPSQIIWGSRPSLPEYRGGQ